MKYRGRRYRRATISLRTVASALVEVHRGAVAPRLALPSCVRRPPGGRLQQRQ